MVSGATPAGAVFKLWFRRPRWTRPTPSIFKAMVEPLLADANVEFIGEINDAEKPAFLSGAQALLFPIDWPEPFGLVMIEAMACGCPVIAMRRGSVPEVMDYGISGFVVDKRGRGGGGARPAARARSRPGPHPVREAVHLAADGGGLPEQPSQLR